MLERSFQVTIQGNATPAESALRILVVAELWHGSNGYAYTRAFRRLGHSVTVVPEVSYVPAWRWKPLRALRRTLEPVFLREFRDALIREAEHLRPDLFVVFKGPYVLPEAVDAIRRLGTLAVNFYPDISFHTHGRWLPKTLPLYDWVFTTKTFGLADMRKDLGINNASFIPHGFDPEVHFEVELDDFDCHTYGCDVSFIGTWSPKKERYLSFLAEKLPQLHIRIWGSQWDEARARLGNRVQGRHVLGVEYAKALRGSKINLAILSEARRGSSRGDQITSRSFHIPATGSFMLHERTEEILAYYEEGVECACFSSPQDLVEKVTYFLRDDCERQSISTAGRNRVIESGYDVEHRARAILQHCRSLLASNDRGEPMTYDEKRT